MARPAGLRFRLQMFLAVCNLYLISIVSLQCLIRSMVQTLAKAFYAKAFDWDFKSNPAGSSHKDEDLAMFGYPDEKLKSLGGGIVKYDKDKMTMKKGGVTVFLYVNDIEAKLKVISDFRSKIVSLCILMRLTCNNFASSKSSRLGARPLVKYTPRVILDGFRISRTRRVTFVAYTR